MSEHDALVAAICDQPDEDTPRLVYADWLEENDRPEQAAFVRAQIELARTPPWEPFAVLCKWRRPDWLTGKPFRESLPRVDGSGVEWHPEAFRRGLGWRLNVRSLIAWEQTGARVLAGAPIGEMHLWGSNTLDQWRAFAASPLVPRLRTVHFVTSPTEPLRVLRDLPAVLGITDLYFERASSPGMPFVVEDLLASPLGKAIRGLHFHMGGEPLEDLLDALVRGEPRLERLSLSAMGLTADHIRRLCDGPLIGQVRELDLRNNHLEDDGIRALARDLPASIHTLGLAGTGKTGRGLEEFTHHYNINRLHRLDLSRDTLTPRLARALSRSAYLAGLRSLSLSKCLVGERELHHLVRAKFWPNLVELDLRENPIPPAGVQHLLDAEVPADLTALVLTGDQLGTESRNELRKKYRDSVVFAASEVAGL